jgi:hypothetical protein
MDWILLRFADNVGDALTFKILKNDLVTVLHKSVLWLAADANHQNKQISLRSNVQELFKSIVTKPSFVWKDIHHNQNSRMFNDDVTSRTRSKEGYTDQHVGSRTRCKMHNVNNPCVQNKEMEMFNKDICN